MVKTALLPLQGALYSRLANDTALNNVITGVYDAVSADASFPYVSLGEDIATPWDTKTTYGENIRTTIHCWSQYDGKKEAKQILDLMLQALSGEPLQLGGGFSMVLQNREQLRVFPDIDGTTYHGVLTVRFIINN